MTFNRLHKQLFKRRGDLLFFFFVLTSLFSLEGYSEGADLFSAQSLIVEGKKLAVIPTDLDGQGMFEIVVISKTGVYPKEKRWISIFKADTSAQYSTTAGQRWEVDRVAAIADVGDVAPSPGKEIFYLTGDGISYYAQEENGNFSATPHNLLLKKNPCPLTENNARSFVFTKKEEPCVLEVSASFLSLFLFGCF